MPELRYKLKYISKARPSPGRTSNFVFANGLVLALCLANAKKDHQRMMVDPMFMIVQILRSFPTAVTTTAVAPIAVILPVFT